MPLYHKGANYENRANIKDQFTLGALDDLASQIQAVVTQGNFSKQGKPQPPSTPVAVAVTSNNGLVTATISHPNAEPGTRWVVQYDTSPQFPAPITEEAAYPVWQKQLPQRAVYVRVAAKFLTSDNTPWVYYGSSASPQPST